MCAARARCSLVRGRRKGRSCALAHEIRLVWPLRWSVTVLFAAVVLTALRLSVKSNNAGGCDNDSLQHTSIRVRVGVVYQSLDVNIAHVNRLFLMWSVAVHFQVISKSKSKQKLRFVVIINTKGLLLMFFLKSSAVVIRWLLLSCGDVERNPGPTRANVFSKYISSADGTPVHIRKTSDQSYGPDRDLNQRLFSMAGYSQHENIDILEKFKCWYGLLQKENDQLKARVDLLASKCQVLEQQCEHLFQWKDLFTDISHQMNSHVDKIESFSRRNNLRFFNVFEGPSETSSKCTRMIVQLLNRFFPSKQWTIDDVERAHRVGRRSNNSNYPRPIVARLFHWQDKLTILREQECRKEMAETLGIRVASDLTSRQSQIIKEERNAGRHAFFWKGRLFYRSKQHENNKRDALRHTDNVTNATPARYYYSKTSHPKQQRQMDEPVNQHDNQHDMAQEDVDQHHTYRDVRHLQQKSSSRNSVDDFPWTVDMISSPPLSGRQTEDMNVGRQVYVWKGRLYHKRRNMQHHGPRKNPRRRSNSLARTADHDDSAEPVSPRGLTPAKIRVDSTHLQSRQRPMMSSAVDLPWTAASFTQAAAADSSIERFNQHDPVPTPIYMDSTHPQSQWRPVLSSDEGLPWTADMAAFPPLPNRSTQEMPCRTRGEHREERECRQKPVDTGHGAPADVPETAPSHPPQPQRTPRPSARMTVNQWGVRLTSTPNTEDENHVPRPSSGNARDRLSVESRLHHEHDTQTSCLMTGEVAPTSDANQLGPVIGRECAVHRAFYSSTDPSCDAPLPPSTQQAVPGGPDADLASHTPCSPRPSSTTPPASEAKADDSTTMVKRLVDPWTGADELESQSFGQSDGRRDGMNCLSVTHLPVVSEQQNCSMISETPKTHGRQTRSKTKMAIGRTMTNITHDKTTLRQKQVTDCFPRIDTGSSQADRSQSVDT